MNRFKQALYLFFVNLLGLPQRWYNSFVAVIGAAGAVAILMGIFSLLSGFQETMKLAGNDDIAIVIQQGAKSEMRSFMPAFHADLIANTAGPERSTKELFTSFDLAVPGTRYFINMTLRGLSKESLHVRKPMHFVQGRMFQWGTGEIIIGKSALKELPNVALNDYIDIGSTQWQVVGIFEDNGSVLESEIWLDALLLRALYDRGYSSVRVKLDGEDSLQHLRDTLSSDQRLRVSVMRESEYYASQSEDIEKFVYYIGYPLLLLMALGTLLVNLSSMSASVSTRKTEIATLQALGFSPGKICVAVLLESTCLGLLGGVLGVLVVYLFADGIALSTVNDMSFSQVNFVLSTTPEIALTGIGLSVLIGLIGGFSAVYSIVKMPIVEALR